MTGLSTNQIKIVILLDKHLLHNDNGILWQPHSNIFETLKQMLCFYSIWFLCTKYIFLKNWITRKWPVCIPFCRGSFNDLNTANITILLVWWTIGTELAINWPTLFRTNFHVFPLHFRRASRPFTNPRTRTYSIPHCCGKINTLTMAHYLADNKWEHLWEKRLNKISFEFI